MLTTLPFDSRFVVPDDATAWSVWQERGLRELRYRAAFPEELETAQIVSLVASIPARDAGQICHICGEEVSWLDHLPPLYAGGAVRCFTNVIPFERYRDARCVQ